MYYCDFIELSQLLKMASCQIGIPVPQPMCCKGNLEANWKAFGESWNDYRIATELDKKARYRTGGNPSNSNGSGLQGQISNIAT